MKKIKLSPVILSIIISCTLLTQGCMVYSRRIAPESAIGKGPVRVFTERGESFEFKSLAGDSGQIFGVKGSGNSIKYKEIPGKIRYVRLKNREASAVLTTIAILAGGIGILIISDAVNPNLELSLGVGSSLGGGFSCFDPKGNQPVFRK